MKLAFSLFKYFPYGGLQRDFLRISKLCAENGHEIIVYTMQWQGDYPEGFKVIAFDKQYYSNHNNAMKFASKVNSHLKSNPVDLVIGFDKMPGLDVYYCADSCYVTKVCDQKSKYIQLFYSLTSRYKKFKWLEHSVFANQNKTKILFISKKEQENYQRVYKTPDNQCYLLPPQIDKNRFKPVVDNQIKNTIKQELNNISDISFDLDNYNNPWLLMVGSGFRTKGVDRSIRLIKYLVKNNKPANLIIIGQDNPDSFIKLAKSFNIDKYIKFLSGRDDIAKFYAVADLLLHPAYRENTGTVLLESIIMGLPVVASGICGYSEYITKSNCGSVIPEPFSQKIFNNRVLDILTNQNLKQWSENGLTFRENANIYNADSKILEVIEAGYND